MSEDFKPRKPDYTLSVLDRKTGIKGPIGAAWKNDDGSITIKINSFVVLDTTKMELVVRLFPTEEKRRNTTKGLQTRTQDYGDAREEPYDIDEIPF